MSRKNSPKFNPDCRECPRLAGFLDQVAEKHPDYHARPVAPFGDDQARFLIVGLAPGMHGANASGRPFTGDHAGILLYQTLFDCGFSNKPESVSLDDGLELYKGIRKYMQYYNYNRAHQGIGRQIPGVVYKTVA